MVEPQRALVLAGHGSLLNPDSAVPVYSHADAIRELGLFAEVREAFWKEEPAIGEVLRILESEAVYVVPLFMSEGYFTDRILPRELRLGKQPLLDGEKAVEYTPPVGTHQAMRDVIVGRAVGITGDPDVGDGVGLALVGHGTERHETSGRSTREHARAIRELGRFEEIHALFMDEEPSVEDYLDHFETEEIVVVPFFVADGYHTTEDLPEDLGLTANGREGYDVPTEVDGRRVWYTGAVGTDPRMVDVILKRVREAGGELPANGASNTDANADPAGPVTIETQIEALGEAVGGGVAFDGLRVQAREDRYTVEMPDERRSGLDEAEFREWARNHTPFVTNWYYWTQIVGPDRAYRWDFLRWLERAEAEPVPERYDRLRDGIDRSWGELRVSVTLGDAGKRRYELGHVDDRSAEPRELDVRRDPRDARELATYDGEGRYRPLKSVPSLPGGWVFRNLTGEELVRAIDYVYPASIPNWHLARSDALDVTHWREMADRQTGIYEVVSELPDEAVGWAAEACCVDSQCLKRRRWELDEGRPLDVPAGEGPIPCRAPCSLFVAGAREWTLLEQESDAAELEDLPADDTGADAVREADFGHEANRYRVRYLRARNTADRSEPADGDAAGPDPGDT